MRRRIITALSILSLIACVTTIVLCMQRLGPRGHFAVVKRDSISVDLNGDSIRALVAADGSIHLAGSDQPADYDWHWGGFWYCRSYCSGQPVWDFVAPYWLPIVLTAVLPAFWFFREAWRIGLRRGRLRAGRCGNCGYDLRATRTRCPECGSPTSRQRESGFMSLK